VKAPGTQRPLVVAHRGSSLSAPENTMAAFRLAVDAGADMIEFDVRMTRDFELVVHHDRSLGRTSDGSGRVWDLTLDEMRGTDAGSWHSRRFAGERIPTLRQVLDEIPFSVGLDIEVKTDGDRRRGAALPESVLLLVRESRREDSVVVSSFDHRFLRRLHHLDPSLRLGALLLPVRDGFRSPSQLARRTGASMFICSRTQLRARHMRDARAAGLSVAVYGVNTAADLAKARRAGVHAVITDNPARIIRALGSA
jgi:glycerophosphoryl diester phosphodiesterase